MTLMEALTVIAILGIVLFITLPHLTQTHESNDLMAMKAKAIQLNAAKDAYIAAYGLDNARANWINGGNADSRYQMFAKYLPAGSVRASNPSSPLLKEYVVPGFTVSFTQSGYLIPITNPVVIETYDGNSTGTTPIAY